MRLGRLPAAFSPCVRFIGHRSTYISLTFMSRFTSVMASDAPTSGALSDALTSNALTVAGAAGVAGVGVMSLAVTATVLPAQTVGLLGASTLAFAAGKRIADGKSVMPSFAGLKQDAPAASADAPTAA